MRSVMLGTFLILFYGVSAAIMGQNAIKDISGLKGFAGCWEHHDKAKSMLISEQWMTPAGTSILGMGRTVKNGRTVDYEYMRIEQQAGGIFFIARPKENAEETAFKLIRSTANEVVFENPEHDFPQRVIYKFNGATLTGRIEGNEKGKFVGIDFPMDRVKCTP